MSDERDGGGPDGGPGAGPLDDADDLGGLAELHGAEIDDCVRIARLVLGDLVMAEQAAVSAFVLTHRRWYTTDDRMALLHRCLTRSLERGLRVPRERPVDPLLAAFAALPEDQRLATAFACTAGLPSDALGAALGTDAGEAEARRREGVAAIEASLSPGTDIAARCRAVPGVTDADETLLEVLRGVTHQVHVREQPRWVLIAIVVGVLLLAIAIVVSVDWGGGDDDVRITGVDVPPGSEGTTIAPDPATTTP